MTRIADQLHDDAFRVKIFNNRLFYAAFFVRHCRNSLCRLEPARLGVAEVLPAKAHEEKKRGLLSTCCLKCLPLTG
jgi:hypothetical protein